MTTTTTTTTTKEIPRTEWKEFLDRFSRVHENWLVTIEVVGPDLGDQIEAEELPLAGISYETKGSEEGGIEILLGGKPDRHVAHLVPAPQRLWLAQDDQGIDRSLAIEEGEGRRTLINFRVPARPESLDGLMGS